MTQTPYARIKATAKLPSPTGVALHILELTQDDVATMGQVTAAVEADPAIASRLLKLVNSPLAGTSRQIAAVSRAVALLGRRTVASLALGFSLLSDHRHGPCEAFDYDGFWAESLAEAVAARHIANHLGSFAPDEAFTCGLLAQIGRLAFATAYPEEYAGVLSVTSASERERLLDIERRTFGINHFDLAAAMMADWQMPAIFVTAVQAQTDPILGDLKPDTRVLLAAQILRLAESIAVIVPRSTVFRDVLSSLVVAAHGLGVTPGVFGVVFDAISRAWCEAGAIYHVPTRDVPMLADIYAQARERQEGMGASEPRFNVGEAWAGQIDGRR